MNQQFKGFSLIASAALLAACGGGGGGTTMSRPQQAPLSSTEFLTATSTSM